MTPEWWISRLESQIEDDIPTMDLWWRYFVGDHPFPGMPEKIRQRVWNSYKAVLERSNANFMGSVIDAVAERCRPIGFRLGADSDFKADLDSWKIWQSSNMDADAPLAIETAFAKGRAFMSIWRHEGDKYPTIAAEDPGQCIVENEPGSRHRRAAALKMYVDEWTGNDCGDLFLPGWLLPFKRPSGSSQWQRDGDPIRNPGGYKGIPIVPLENRPRLTRAKLKTRKYLLWGGDSDLADVTSIQDRINETILNQVIAQWFAAFKQRYATGLVVEEEPVRDANGEIMMGSDGKPLMRPVEPFDAWLDRLWTVDSDKVKFGEFGETDLTGYLKSRERDLQDLSTIKRIPRHYLFQEGQSPSGDAIKSAETGLVAVVRRKHLTLGDPLEETNRIARIMAGDGEAAADSEMVWADPEFQTYGQLVDGVIKEFDGGLITWEEAREKLGYTPQQTARAKGQRNLESLLRTVEDEDPEGEPQLDRAA
nr:phage portal protein [Phytoactinopolyspora alkaliphila]